MILSVSDQYSVEYVPPPAPVPGKYIIRENRKYPRVLVFTEDEALELWTKLGKILGLGDG